jgi:hypothetical protein
MPHTGVWVTTGRPSLTRVLPSIVGLADRKHDGPQLVQHGMYLNLCSDMLAGL